MRRSTSTTTRRLNRPVAVWPTTSPSTTASACTRPWVIEHPKSSTDQSEGGTTGHAGCRSSILWKLWRSSERHEEQKNPVKRNQDLNFRERQKTGTGINAP